jgi:hypothetical protein
VANSDWKEYSESTKEQLVDKLNKDIESLRSIKTSLTTRLNAATQEIVELKRKSRNGRRWFAGCIVLMGIIAALLFACGFK